MIAAALIAGLVPVHANGVSCGAAFSSGNADAASGQVVQDYADALSGRDSGADLEGDCADRRGTQRTFVIPLLVVGALAAGFLALTASRKSDAVSSGPDTTG